MNVNDFGPVTVLRPKTGARARPNLLAVCLGVVCVMGVLGALGVLYALG